MLPALGIAAESIPWIMGSRVHPTSTQTETLCKEQLRDVLDVIEKNSTWLEANPGGSIPRFLGMHPFTTGPATGERCSNGDTIGQAIMHRVLILCGLLDRRLWPAFTIPIAACKQMTHMLSLKHGIRK